MALNASGIILQSNAFAAAATHIAIHTAAPGATGINPSAAPRLVAGITVDAAGVMTISNKAFTGGAASGAVHSIGFWSALTAGTFYGSQLIETGDLTFNAAGAYTLNSLVLTPTSTD